MRKPLLKASTAKPAVVQSLAPPSSKPARRAHGHSAPASAPSGPAIFGSSANRPAKGEETRSLILDTAVGVASQSGFEALTIGTLAEKTGLSKSGLFAHFGSKLELQIATLDAAALRFSQAVVLPALKAPRGLARLSAMLEAWIDWAETSNLPGGCPIYAAAIEYDDQPGPMRDAVIERWHAADDVLARSAQMAVDNGELAAGTDVRQLCFELIGIVMAAYHSRLVVEPDQTRLLVKRAYQRLIASYTNLPA